MNKVLNGWRVLVPQQAPLRRICGTFELQTNFKTGATDGIRERANITEWKEDPERKRLSTNVECERRCSWGETNIFQKGGMPGYTQAETGVCSGCASIKNFGGLDWRILRSSLCECFRIEKGCKYRMVW